MSRKHFIAIAAQIKNQFESIRSDKFTPSEWVRKSSLETLTATTNSLCGVFADANPNFDRARFLNACGM